MDEVHGVIDLLSGIHGLRDNYFTGLCLGSFGGALAATFEVQGDPALITYLLSFRFSKVPTA